ncbi:MAG TPA: hypothetical protein VEK79_02985 [Thermoanaerobaculia bacterium]|nr:hypothetical protein [Thermoanaerobaculia bacterium]
MTEVYRVAGVVQSGDGDVRPLRGARVSLFDGREVIGHATTNDEGAFAIAIEIRASKSRSIFYVTADLGGGVVLMAILGVTPPGRIVINELTTVAAAYCAAQFLVDGRIEGDAFALRIVAGMNANLVNVADATPSRVLLASPNADETNALRTTRSLANLLACCVRFPDKALQTFFKYATPPHGPAPRDTITALGNIARDPAHQVGPLFLESNLLKLYEPALREQPVAWTIAVKVNDSGDDAHMFGGPANLAFDRHGRAWITNNVVQGTGDSTEWSILLEPDGRPAAISPFRGGGLLGAGFGVAVDGQGRVWMGSFGWGGVNPTGSVALFDSDAKPLSPEPNGFVGGVYRVQATVVDSDGNVWLASYGNSCVVVYPGGDPRAAVVYQGDAELFTPFGIAVAEDGTVWVTNSNSKASGIVNFALRDGKIEWLRETTIGKTMKDIAIDSLGNIWACSGGDDHMYLFERDGTLAGGYQGGGLDGPWGMTLDGDDNVWAGNFGPLEVGSVFIGRLTQLAGANDNTRPKGCRTGDGLTPQTGYTLPSAGEQVLLRDGTPLYGPEGPPCFIPMMRTTGVNIDAAGNVWTCNNWKPDFNTDLFGDPLNGVAANPGGDGMVIFVGLAKPPRNRPDLRKAFFA